MKCLPLHLLPPIKKVKIYNVPSKWEDGITTSKEEKRKKHLVLLEAQRIEKENKRLMYEAKKILIKETKEKKHQARKEKHELYLKKQEEIVRAKEVIQKKMEEQESLKKPVTRGVNFTTHAENRYNERIAPYWYSLEQVKNDFQKNWRRVKKTWEGTFEAKWAIATYVFARDRISFDYVILTLYLSEKQEQKLQGKF